jgi:hypothetical protein
MPSAGRSSLWPVYVFSFMNSIGTGVVTNGIVFLTKQGYHFSDTKNYLLAVVLGVTYIVGALGAQPGLQRLRRVWPGVSSRGVLAVMMIVMGALCALPQLGLWMQAGGEARATPIWVMIVLYSPLTGVLWPMVEAYVSGGRSGENLLSTVSRWNVVWSSALVAAYVGIAPMVENYAALAVLLLGGVHILAAAVLLWFTPEPAPHREDEHLPHPPVFARLLVTFRLLLPMSYIVSSTLGPYLPGAMERLHVPVTWHTVLAASWLGPRMVMFAVLERWQGWHGRWFPAIVGPVLLLAGFGMAILSGSGALGSAGVAMLAGGLGLFGIGMAVIYSGALYYALEVGKAEVQAGGKHEALIGAGYTAGPMIGLSACAAVGAGWLRQGQFEPVVLAVVGVVALAFAAVVAHRVVRHAG